MFLSTRIGKPNLWAIFSRWRHHDVSRQFFYTFISQLQRESFLELETWLSSIKISTFRRIRAKESLKQHLQALLLLVFFGSFLSSSLRYLLEQKPLNIYRSSPLKFFLQQGIISILILLLILLWRYSCLLEIMKWCISYMELIKINSLSSISVRFSFHRPTSKPQPQRGWEWLGSRAIDPIVIESGWSLLSPVPEQLPPSIHPPPSSTRTDFLRSLFKFPSQNLIPNGLDTERGNEPITDNQDIKILKYSDEQLLFEGFISCIRNYDPDIIVSYDIHREGFGYLIERAAALPQVSPNSLFPSPKFWFPFCFESQSNTTTWVNQQTDLLNPLPRCIHVHEPVSVAPTGFGFGVPILRFFFSWLIAYNFGV